MSTHPYIPLYVDDYEAATAHLSAEEDGVYNRLLRLCWRTPGCSLPVDDAWIARKIRLSTADFDRVGRTMLDEFFRISRGRYIQKRLKDEYDDISRKKTARKAAGKKGGMAKAQKEQEKSASNATILPGDTCASPEPYPEPIEERKPPTPPSGGPSEKLDAALKAYPLEGTANCPPRKAETAWWRAVAVAGSQDRLLAAVHALVASGFAGKPRRFDRWLDDGSFEAFLPGASGDRPGWTGPAEVRAAFAELGEPWCVSWIDRCAWRDLPERSIVAPNAYHLKRMTEDAGKIIASLGISLTLDTERTAA